MVTAFLIAAKVWCGSNRNGNTYIHMYMFFLHCYGTVAVRFCGTV